MKCLEKRLDGNYTRILSSVLNKFWKQLSYKQRLCGHLSPILSTIQVSRARHAVYWWRSSDKFISDVLPTDSYARALLCWLIIKNLYSSTLCRYWVPSRTLTTSILYGQVARERDIERGGESSGSELLAGFELIVWRSILGWYSTINSK